MPIIAKDFSWRQTSEIIYICIPSKGVKLKSIDIFGVDDYVKVSFPPFFFEALLYAPASHEESLAKIGNGQILITLFKKESMIWPQLISFMFENKKFMKQKRQDVLLQLQEESEKKKLLKAEKKRENETYTINLQMKKEQADRDRIKRAKEKAKQEALKDIEDTFNLKKNESNKQEVFETTNEVKSIKGNVEPTFDSKKCIFKPPRNIRASGKINIVFTPRVFPTAARESKAPEEEEWLYKQKEAQRLVDLNNESIPEEERDPVWLKNKGNSLYLQGNYQGAVNAYSHAIQLGCKLPALYSNRAACHLHLKNLIKCLEDSSKALELLNPPVAANMEARCKAHVRRGTAFFGLELYVEGLQDYEMALKLDPVNEVLRKDAEKIRTIIQKAS